MSKSSSATVLKDFRELSYLVQIYEPPSANIDSSSSDPDLILLCGWLDAQPRHIAKYANVYRSSHPSARILLVTYNLAELLYRSSSTLSEARLPAVNVLLSLPKSTRILVHVFSNGGSFSLTALAKAFRERAGLPLAMNMLVLDSTPGRNKLSTAWTALTAGLPKNFVARKVGELLVGVFLVFFIIKRFFSRKTKDAITQMREDVNDKRLFDLDTKRLYIYSDDDGLVGSKDVEDHANEAQGEGWDVQTEVFVGSAHVSHMMNDPGRYWRAIMDLWKRSTRG